MRRRAHRKKNTQPGRVHSSIGMVDRAHLVFLFRRLRPACVLWGAALVFVGVCYAVWDRTIDVHAEGGPVEGAQLVAWVCGAMLTILGIVLARSWRDRWAAIWLLTLAALAIARELDAHELIQHGTAWLPEVHFRLDWLTDSKVALWPKVFWLAVGGAIAGLVIGPPLAMKAPVGKLLREGDRVTWLLMITLAMLGAGYLTDDVLGRGRLGIHYEVTQGIEEVFELWGAIAFMLAAWYEIRQPVSVRDARGVEGPTPVVQREAVLASGSAR